MYFSGGFLEFAGNCLLSFFFINTRIIYNLHGVMCIFAKCQASFTRFFSKARLMVTAFLVILQTPALNAIIF